MTPEAIPVTLSYDWSPWGWWQVTTINYDASCEDGETWRGSHIEHGNTQEEALENYREYLRDEGNENFILIVEGPSIELHHKKYFITK